MTIQNLAWFLFGFLSGIGLAKIFYLPFYLPKDKDLDEIIDHNPHNRLVKIENQTFKAFKDQLGTYWVPVAPGISAGSILEDQGLKFLIIKCETFWHERVTRVSVQRVVEE